MKTLKVQLASVKSGNSIVLEDDPRGLDSLEQTIKRSDDNDGVMFEITLSLGWTKKGKAFIQADYETYGIESVVIVNIFYYDPNKRQPLPYYTGQVDMTKYSINETEITAPIQQVGFQKKTMNLFDVDVNLETTESQAGLPLPATPTHQVEFHAKKILKTSASSTGQKDGDEIVDIEFQQLDVIVHTLDACIVGPCHQSAETIAYGQFDNTREESSELEGSHSYPWGFHDPLGAITRLPIYDAVEPGTVDVALKSRFKMTIIASQSGAGADTDIDSPCSSSGILGGRELKVYFEHRAADDTLKALVLVGTSGQIVGCGDSEVDGDYETFEYNQDGLITETGDKVYFYMTLRIFAEYNLAGGAFSQRHINHEVRILGDHENTSYSITAATIYAPTVHKTILIHDGLKKLVQYCTDQVDSFKSTFFGRTDSLPAYPADGPGSLMGILNGRILRLLENQDVFTSLSDAMTTLKALWNVSLGFETVDGITKVVVEERSYFWNKNQQILLLGRVSNLKKDVAMNYYFSQVSMSYPKLDAGEVNGVDEFNTARNYNAPLTAAKNTLNLKPLWKASGFEIETQRRLQTTTKDSRSDENMFMAMLRRDGPGFKTQSNQGFAQVDNVYDPDTVYNLLLSPARCVKRWAKYLAAPLWASAQMVYKFASGQGNYQMITKLDTETTAISEGGNMDVTVEADYKPEVYTFTYPLSKDEFDLIKESPYGFITFQDTLGNNMDGYILQVGHKPTSEEANFKLLKVFRPAV